MLNLFCGIVGIPALSICTLPFCVFHLSAKYRQVPWMQKLLIMTIKDQFWVEEKTLLNMPRNLPSHKKKKLRKREKSQGNIGLNLWF